MNQYEMYYGLQVVSGDNKLSSAYEENAHIKGPKVICDYFLQNGNYLRLDNITLGYNVPVKKLGFMQNLRLYLTGQNLFTITGYKGIDPEVDMVGLDNMGIERTRYYPASRSFILGLNVTF